MMVGFRLIFIFACGAIAWVSFVLPGFAAEVTGARSLETIEEIDRQLEREPLSEELLGKKVAILYKKKDSHAVIATARPILTRNPKSVLALKAIAMSFCRLKDYRQAIEFLNRLIILEPAYDSIFVRGSCRLRVGLYKEALDDNDWCLKLHPNDGRTYLQRAEIRRSQVGNLDEKCEFYLKKAIELSPNDPLVQQDFATAMKQLEKVRKISGEKSE